MNAKRFILALVLFVFFYTVFSVLTKTGVGIRLRKEDTEITKFSSNQLIPSSIPASQDGQETRRFVPRMVKNKSVSEWKYNVSLSPEYYALWRAPETGKSQATDLDRKSITRLETRATMASKQGEAVKRFPTTLIIGVRKGGTRALLAILNVHPQVKSCGPEVHFFDQRYPRGLLWYRNQTPGIVDGQQTIEKTPSYFVVYGVPQRILAYSKAINKTLKFLVIFRDPTIRAISDYVQIRLGMKAKFNKNVAPFEKMVMKNDSRDMINTAWGVIRTGVYSKHLERWLQFFPRDWFHFVSGEQLVTNPYREIKQVETFLGLKPFFKETNFAFNAKKGFPCFRGSNEKSSLRCLGKAKGRTHPKVDPKILAELRRYYRPFNEQLYKMVDRDFQWP